MGIETLICKCCGGLLKPNSSICECDYCGAINIITGESGKIINQLNRANKLRQDKEFERALSIYDDILSENPPSADVLWSITLCEYGIEYVPDPASSKYIPTLHRIKDESILNNSSYLEALSICDEKQKETIEKEAKIIANIQNDYLDIVSKEKPYDIFICYKETDETTNMQTEDSGIGLDLYERLANYGFKVFFSRITLQDKIGVNYEPYIFGALKSAKIMVVIGTKEEYFSAVWVKNEWTRFVKLMEVDKNKQIFFACNKVEDLPLAFQGRQAQLLNQPNAVQNLAYSIKRYFEMTGQEMKDDSEEEWLLFIIKNEPDSKKAKEILQGFSFKEIDALANPKLAKHYNVQLAPTLVVIKGGIIEKYVRSNDIKRYADKRKNGGIKITPQPQTETVIAGYTLNNASKELIDNALLSGEKVKAIKYFREATGIGLKEAKDAIEIYEPIFMSKAGTDITINNSMPTSSNKKKGCYVASCVYGSYDCPEVWTLRRFRDYTLDKTWYGRAFIKTYYAISPIVVKCFGDYKLFRDLFKHPLDKMVKRLSIKGYDNTPYEDKY